MSTEFFNDQWRIPSNENQNKVSNYSMEFDHLTNNSISIGNTLTNGFSQLTVSVWVNFSSFVAGKNYGLVSKDGLGQRSFDLRYINGTGVNFLVSTNGTSVSNSSYYPVNSINIGQWYHFVGVYDGSNVLFYVDGTLIGTPTALTGSLQNTTSDFFIGKRAAAPTTTTFDGQIDQVSIFDYALSQDQITQLGAEGYAFNFIPNDYIDANTTVASNLDFSVSTWIKPNSYSMPILGTRGLAAAVDSNGITININSSGNLWARIFTETSNVFNLQTGSTISLNNWSHVAMTYDSSTKTLKSYLNGTEAGSMVGTDPSVASTADLDIGRGSIGTIYGYFDGEISNTATFNTELTPTQVNTLYNNGKPGDISSLNPTGWWKLDDTATFNSGTSVWSIPDDSSNSNTGTSVGMNASNLVASNINGELIANPMITSPKPIAYYQLGDQSVYNGANYLVPNNSLSDYVFNFDGTDDYIDTGTGLGNSLGTYTGDASVSLWFKAGNTASNDGLFSITAFNDVVFGNLRINIYNNLLYFVSSGTGNYKTIPFTDTTSWHHLVCIFKSGDITNSKIYLDGVDKTTTDVGTFPSSLSFTGLKTIIGAYHSVNQVFQGELSNVSIFNTELTSTQVETLYNNGSPATDISSLSPVAWYKLNAADTFDGTNWTINDYGSGGNDGTSSGMDSSSLIVSTLQKTNGYSPYALDFGGITAHLKTNTIPVATNTVTLSAWVKRTGAAGQYAGVFGVRNSGGSPAFGLCWQISFGNGDNKIRFRTSADSSSAWQEVVQNDVMPDNTWHHVTGVADGTNLKIYINGTLQTDTKTQTNGTLQTPFSNIFFGMQSTTSSPFNGQLSNCARWNVGLTQAQVTEIYNQGRPSNLNTFSGNAPIGWWQLGSNSSFESNNWTCLDEIGTDNADSTSSASMSNDDIVDGVGYSASGLGTSSIDIKGDAPYSTANGLSENMDVLDRTTDVPS